MSRRHDLSAKPCHSSSIIRAYTFYPTLVLLFLKRLIFISLWLRIWRLIYFSCYRSIPKVIGNWFCAPIIFKPVFHYVVFNFYRECLKKCNSCLKTDVYRSIGSYKFTNREFFCNFFVPKYLCLVSAVK